MSLGEFDRARSLYARLRACAGPARRPELETRAALGESMVLMVGQHPDMSAFGEQVVEPLARKYPRSPSAPYLWMQRGKTFTGHSWNKGSPERVAHFRKVYRDYPSSHLAELARWFEIYHGINEHVFEKNRELYERYRRDYPEGRYLRQVAAHEQIVLDNFKRMNNKEKL